MVSTIELVEKLHTLADPTKLHIIAFIQAKKKTTFEEIKDYLKLSSTIVYKYLRELDRAGFIESNFNKNIFSIRKFNISINPEIILYLIRSEEEYLNFFTQKYGIKKIDEFYNLFRDYEKGKLTLRTLAAELKLDYSELVWLIHCIGLEEKTEWKI